MSSTNWQLARAMGSGEFSEREEWMPKDHPDRIAWEKKRDADREQVYVDKARQFHEAYERLAPEFGYATRDDTKEFDPTTPNGRLMVAVMKEIQ